MLFGFLEIKTIFKGKIEIALELAALKIFFGLENILLCLGFEMRNCAKGLERALNE